jgi:ankyrin repeat protein
LSSDTEGGKARTGGFRLSKTQLADLPMVTMGGGSNLGPQSRPALKADDVLGDRYVIKSELGVGGMGVVYSAYDRNLDKDIAIKVLLPHLLNQDELRRRFQEEGKIASELSHPNIVNVFDVRQDADMSFITMELLEGQTLRDLINVRLQSSTPFGLKEGCDLVGQVCDALAYAHKRTVHRDIKPENLWVCPDGTLKLMDFGIARLLRSTTQVTTTGGAMGTAYYMSPEQLRNPSSVGPAADQYSVAVVLYEILTGSIPAGRARSVRDLRKGVPRKVSNAIDKGLEMRPEDRHESVADFKDAICGTRGGGGVSVPKLPPTSTLAKIGGVLAVIGILAFLGFSAPGRAALNSATDFASSIAEVPSDDDAAASPKGRTEAAVDPETYEAQGRAAAASKRVEQAGKDISSNTTKAQRGVESANTAFENAKGVEQQRRATRRLEQANTTASVARELEVAWRRIVEQGSDHGAALGLITLGQRLLRQGESEPAREAFSTAEGKLDAMLAAYRKEEALQNARGLREQLERLIARWVKAAGELAPNPPKQIVAARKALSDAKTQLEAGDAEGARGHLQAGLKQAYAAISDLEERLEAAKASLAKAAKTGRTPLFTAVQGADLGKISMALKAGADVNRADEKGVTPLLVAVASGKVEVIEYLLAKEAALDVRDKGGASVLHVAAKHGRVEAVELLLQKGISVGAKDGVKRTPLHTAAANAQAKVVSLLLEKGAKADARDGDGDTPLHLAARAASEEAVVALLAKGASARVRNDMGFLPTDMAGNQNIRKHLKAGR